MTFERGSSYLINYGSFSKVATFVETEDGKNLFFDLDGEFVFSDEFLTQGKVILSRLKEE
ncbi:hypothetical protein Elgi_36810 [Paenibacillus elgii]|uniref:hypothetical protein n=1 Tax=Paenibacillus elgii TaxID=189691 RepID=UPI00049283B7|nr:hypothetical protein [Paenibacillus elgii]GMX64412.1 hypothetical protein Elgi_36810 [Paenibacillus elgii]